MTIRQLSLLGALVLFALPAAADNLTGRWEGNVASDNGPIQTVFEFVHQGDRLTGTIANNFIPPLPLEDGVVKGDKITFNVKLMQIKLRYEGVVKGDELTLTSKVVEGTPNPAAEATFKVTRSK